MKALRKLMTSALVLGCATVVVASPAIAWQPNKPIDFIIMAGKGGGADKMARLMQGIVEKESLAERPLVPVNKSGGSGAEALMAAKSASDPDHTIMVTLNSFYTTPLRQPGLDVDVLTVHSRIDGAALEDLLLGALFEHEVLPGVLVKVAHHGIVVGSRSLGHRLLHVTLCTEAHQVILAVPIEWIDGDLMYVIHFELAFRTALGATTTFFYAYFIKFIDFKEWS